MGCVSGEKNPADAQVRELAMMDAKIAAPVDGKSLQLGERALSQQFPHQLERGWLLFGVPDHGDDAPATPAHGKNRQWPEFARAKLHLVGRQRLVRLHVRQHE